MERNERRKYRRFPVRERTFAVFGSRASELGQITDISRAGVGIRYITHRDSSSASSELEIYLADRSFHVEKVPFKTVWDVEIANLFPSTSITMRQRGVQFGELTQDQIDRLGYLICNHTRVVEMTRSGGDRRKVYDLDYFFTGGTERRSGKKRRYNDRRYLMET